MSLRARLSLLITLLFLLILVGGSVFIIENARRSIHDEVKSAATFTLQLIDIALSTRTESGKSILAESLLSNVSQLESSRHLQIRLINRQSPENRVPVIPDLPVSAEAPRWFIEIVKPEIIEYRRVFGSDEYSLTEVLIRADPSDEISEVWADTKYIIVMFILFVVLCIFAVYYTLGRGLAPISTILKGLEGIEQGEYRLRLPEFKLAELSQISEKFNLMAGELDKTQQENRELTQRSLAIQESERQSLAHELHDELGQSIAAIKAVATSIGQSGQDSASQKDSVRTIIDVSDHMYNVARGMMRRLRPAVLDEFGLIRALQDMIDDWNSVHEEVFCQFEFNSQFERLTDTEKISIYRIIQESLTNVIKHSQSSQVSISLIEVSDKQSGQENFPCFLRLEITDNGIGFDDSQIKRGLGFLGMQERVDALSGELKIKSKTGEGLNINIRIPISDSDE